MRNSDLRLDKKSSCYAVAIPREGLERITLNESDKSIFDEDTLYMELQRIPGVDSVDYSAEFQESEVFFSIDAECDMLATRKKVRNTIAKHLRK